MNIFDCAITIEQRAKAYYEQLAKDTTLTEQKNLFSLLAAAEQQHIETLARMKEKVAGSGAEVESCEEPDEATMPLYDRNLRNDPDFFLHAVREEERDIRHYEDLAAKMEDAGVRVSLLLLAEEERKHLEVVENIYSYVEAPREYLEWVEFPNDKEL